MSVFGRGQGFVFAILMLLFSLRSGIAVPDPSPEPAGLPADRLLVCCSGGVERTCFLRLPPGYDGKKKLPLVLLLHGRGGDPLSAEEYTGMGLKANRGGFILACPAAVGDPATWSVGLNSGLRDNSDVVYLGSLIDQLVKWLAVDPLRVFVVGHSSGAMMAYRLAAETSGKIAAIAVAAGTVGARTIAGTWTMLRAPSSPISLIAFHGTQDPTMPYSAADTGAYNNNFLPAAESVARWAREVGCRPVPVRTVMADGRLVRDVYAGGRDGAEVELYSIVGGDHWWPGDTEDAAYVTPADQVVNATDLIWEFFKRHPRTVGAAAPAVKLKTHRR